MTNTQLLREKIAESGIKYTFIASKLNISTATLNSKIKNNSEFKASEILKICMLIPLDDLERNEIFFSNNVEK